MITSPLSQLVQTFSPIPGQSIAQDWKERLQADSSSDYYEFIEGIPYARVRLGTTHVLVGGNLLTALKTRLQGTPCRAYGSGICVCEESTDTLLHPDITISCDPEDLIAADALRAPRLVVEILNHNSAAYQRGPKFAAYRRIAAIREIVFVDIESLRVETYTRHTDGYWVLHDYSSDNEVHLNSLSLNVPLREVFCEIGPMGL